jgi:hypothetical protein
MLTAFIDDSGMNQPPVSVLAGWVAPTSSWAAFTDDWDKILRMSPRIRYFKFDDATNFKDEFNGISEASRDEKIKLMVDAIAEHQLLGVATVIPHFVFHKYFGKHDKGVLKHPYALSFFMIMSRLYRHYASLGSDGKIDFVFDQQNDQMLSVLEGWQEFCRLAAAEHKPMIGSPPSFKDDQDILPLQAADLHAGWVRQLNAASIEGRSLPVPPWGDKGSDIQRLNWVMTEDVARDIHKRLSDGEG